MYKTNESQYVSIEKVQLNFITGMCTIIAPPTTLITQPDNTYSLFDFMRTFFPLSLFDIFNGETFTLSIHIYSHLKISKKGSRGEGDNPYRVGEGQAKLKEESFWQEGSYKGDINLGKFSKQKIHNF